MRNFMIVVILFLGLSKANACIGPDVTLEEASQIENDLVFQLMDQQGINIQEVSAVQFLPGFILSRGQKGNCRALNAFGSFWIQTTDLCRYRVQVTTRQDDVDFEVSKTCP